ncbi:nuclear pore complex protein Nup214-like protein, partial [Leptotrombidium deliense]
KITSVCWSPKGKQLVVGKVNGALVQLKHVNGTSFQEAKTIPVPPEFPAKVLNIKWVLSSMFLVVYVDDRNAIDPITKYVAVFAPPKKQPQFFDHGSVCLNAAFDDVHQRYDVEFCQIGDLVLCLSSMSSEVGVIGADCEEVTSPTSWNQFILEDNSRIELPMNKNGFESFPKGVSFFRNSSKVFRISENEQYGGNATPLLLIMSSSGLLCPYYVVHRAKPFALITPPTTQLPYELTATQKLPSSVIPSGHSSSPAYKAVPEVKQVESFVPSTPVTSEVKGKHLLNDRTSSVESVTTVNLANSSPEKITLSPEKNEKLLKEELEKSFLIAIIDEIRDFQKELDELKQTCNNVSKLEIGSADEKQFIVAKTKESQEVIKELKELYNNLDVDTLQGFVLESFAMAEDARCRVDRDVDERYKKLLSKRALNPRIARIMKKMEETSKYIELQLREVNNVLDHEWREKVEKQKKCRSPSEYEMILKLLANNQKTLSAMKCELHKLESQSPKSNKVAIKNRNVKEEIKKLVKSMGKTTLDDSIEEELIDDEDKVVTVRVLKEDKKKKLLEFFEQRNVVPVIKANVPVDLKSSRFVSAVVKAQEILKSIEKKKETPKKIENVSAPISKTKPVQQKEEFMNKISELPKNITVTPIKPVEKVNKQLVPPATVPLPAAVTPKASVSFQTIQTTPQASVVKPLPKSNVSVVASPKPVFPVKTVTAPIAKIPTAAELAAADSTKTDQSVLKDDNGNIKGTSQTSSAFNNQTGVSNKIPVTPKPPEPNVGSVAPKFNVSSSFSFGASSDVSNITPKAAITTTTASFTAPITTASEVKTSLFGTSSQTPFKFGLVGDTSFSFSTPTKSVEEKNVESTSKYDEITPPTSPKKEDRIENPATVTTESTPVKQVSFSFKQKSQELSEKSKEQPPPPSFSSVVTPTAASEVTSSSDKTVTSVSGVVTPISVPTTAAVTSTSIIAPVSTKFGEPVTSAATVTTTSSFASSTLPVFSSASQVSSPAPLFGQSASFQSPTSVFGAPQPATTQSVFGQNLAAPTSIVSPFSQATSQANQNPFPSSFSFCNLGGKPNPENVNKNPFGGAFGATSSTSSLFGSQSGSAFSPKPESPTGSGSFTSGSGVAQAGFGAFQQQQTPKFGGFGAAPAFGGSPSFGGGAVFGGSPGFGTSPVFGSSPGFGSAPTFQPQSPQQPTAFSGYEFFFAAATEMPTFGAIASQQQQPTFGSMPQQAETPSFGSFSQGFTGFGSPQQQQFASPQFSQRRQ